MAGQVYFYAKECPLSEQCSAQSWKKASCWGETEEGAREQLVRHLMTSGHHKLSKTDAQSMAELATMEEYYEEEEAGPPAKKQAVGAAIGAKAAQQASSQALLPRLAAGMPSSHSSGLMPASSSGLIFLRVHEFQSSIGCVNRALHSAQQAHRLSLAASRAFADEVAALTEVKQSLEAIKAAGEIQAQSSSH